MNLSSQPQGVLSAIAVAIFVPLTAASPAQAERVSDGLIALYDFAEGEGTTVHDSSGFGDPLNLTAVTGHQGTRWNWIDGAISVVEPTIFQSPMAATKLFDALLQTDAIMIEAWVRPANDMQGDIFDPAEIVTVASGTSSNLDLFQSGNDFGGYVDLIRNLGDRITADDSVQPSALQHVVYTNSDAAGTANLYVDNMHVRSVSFSSDEFALDPTFPLAVANRPGAIHPWLGEIHLVAIYNRALSLGDIDQNFQMGPNPELVPEPTGFVLLVLAVAAVVVSSRKRLG